MSQNDHRCAYARLSVAPMMDWTDRHCRYLHRLMSRHTLLYTEMVTAAALVHGDAPRLLAMDEAEHPVALQIGGSEPELIAQAVRIAAPFGYDEVNLNVGCPSDRVQSGCFGAVLMRDPELVRDCMAAIAENVGPGVRVSVKSRIGVDDQAPEVVLPGFIETVAGVGVTDFVVHARKAWLEGLSPKENRDIPPLDYDLVLAMKRRFADFRIGINGGIMSLDQAVQFLEAGMDQVMIGRAAYQTPAAILLDADRRIFGADNPLGSAEDAVLGMLPYIQTECARGTRLSAITRHMIGLFTGRPGARRWRQVLSEGAHQAGAGPELVERALGEITKQAA